MKSAGGVFMVTLQCDSLDPTQAVPGQAGPHAWSHSPFRL